MNERAAQALYAAEAAGVRQIKGQARDEHGGRCAIGVLEDALGDEGVFEVNCEHPSKCPICDDFTDGLVVVAHLNDVHGLTFAEIARKLGPDSA